MNEYQIMSIEDLIKEAKGLDYMIYEAECYGRSDMLRLSACINELAERGIEPVEGHTGLKFNY